MCGLAQPGWEKRFEQAYTEFLRLNSQYQAGQMSHAAYRQALEGIMFADEKGDFWMLGARSGRWYRSQGGAWLPADPPLENDMQPASDRSGKLGQWFAWGSAALGLVLSVGFLILFALGSTAARSLDAQLASDVPTDQAWVTETAGLPADLPIESTATVSLPALEDTADVPTATMTTSPLAVPTTPPKPIIELLTGNALEFSDPPDYIGFANSKYQAPPPEIYIATTCQDCWRYNQWFTIAGDNTYIEVASNIPVTAMGVQFWGDSNDNWAEVLLDGEAIYQTSVQGEDANWPGGAFVRYLSISNLPLGQHTLRVRDVGVGPGGGVTLYFFGLGETSP